MFRRVPDTDYVYCLSAVALYSSAYIRWCQAAWEVVHTSRTWGDFADRLRLFDAEFGEFVCGHGDSDIFSDDTDIERSDALHGLTAEPDIAGLFPFGGGDAPYGNWWADLPDEMLEGMGEALDPDGLAAMLEVASLRGESTVEDCALIEELNSLYVDVWPPRS